MSQQHLETAGCRQDMLNYKEVEPINLDDIIDVSKFDFTDEERWLYASPNYPPEGNVGNLYTWLRDGPHLDNVDNENLNGSRRSIDTRTFTRPKKRHNRLSFDTIMGSLSPPIGGAWNAQILLAEDNSSSTSRHIKVDEEDAGLTNHHRQFVPAMLRPSISGKQDQPGKSNICVESGHESMEAFLNMSQSKGIDSFINLMEPEFPDMILNVSQPSELNFTPAKENVIREIPQPAGIEDSQILTNSMMQTSIFSDVSDVKQFNDETFLREFEDETVLEHDSDIDNITFTANSESYKDLPLNSTFNTFTRKLTLLESSAPTQVEEQCKSESLTSVPTDHKMNFGKTFPKLPNKKSTIINNHLSQERRLDIMNVTLDLDCHSAIQDVDVDIKNKFHPGEVIRHNVATFDDNLDLTSNKSSDLRRELLEQVQRNSEEKFDSIHNHDLENCTSDRFPRNHNDTYRKMSSKISDKRQNNPCDKVGDSNQENVRKYYTFTKKTNNSKLHGAAGSDECLKNLDHTFQKPATNHFNKKLQAPRVLSKVPRFFQKSNPNLTSKDLSRLDLGPSSIISNLRQGGRKSQLDISRKSIPNLTSKDLGSSDEHLATNIPNLRYGVRGIRREISRNVDGSLKNKLLYLERLKNESEQRPLEMGDDIKEFRSNGACGSTESIESTQSVHSAPDFDDRLSVCSDSSHNSMGSQPITSSQLHYIARLQEQSLSQISTPKPSRRIMENTWVQEEKDLPSPILKGDDTKYEREQHSPKNIGHNVETSSPILSPAKSMKCLSGNTTYNASEAVLDQSQVHVIKKPEMVVKPLKHTGMENKTKLRAPSNWNATNRASNMVSGIPRPASRIPAPRFSRPSIQHNQTDWKKGCL